MAKVLILRASQDGASVHYRIDPYKSIKSDIEFIISDKFEDAWQGDKLVDGVLVQRPTHLLVPKFLTDLKENGVKTVVDTDDDLLNIPAGNPVGEYFKQQPFLLDCYKKSVELCDYLSVSTPELLAKQGEVFFNGISGTPVIRDYADRDIDLLWTGSVAHGENLMLIRSIVDKYKVALMGNVEYLKHYFPNATIIPYGTFDEYMNVLSRAKIVLVPLKPHPFNRKKSELKCIESSYHGTVSICSNITPYQRFNKFGGNVLVKKDKHKQWADAIESLLDNRYLWEQLSSMGIEAVKKYYNLEIINQKRVKFWQRILS